MGITLDEAIENAKEKAKEQQSKYDKCPTRLRYNCEMCFHKPKCNEIANENEQLAKWLEELKIYRQHEVICHNGYNAGYNKVIDEFTEKLIRISDTLAAGNDNTRKYLILHFKEIAEQLKAGGNDEQKRQNN